MEAVIFIGLQASGKSTFYQQKFFHSHVRISLDLLKTRHREARLLQLCTETQMPFVVDNTNASREQRAVYIAAAKAARFRVIGYYFQSRLHDCRRRNEERDPAQQVPLRGIFGTLGRLERPYTGEGFDELFYVATDSQCRFVVQEWKDEI